MFAPHTDLERNLIAFCRVLRDQDLLVSPSEVIDALRAVETIDVVDRTEMWLALRTVLTARREDVPVFDAAFEEFWRTAPTEGGDDHFTVRDPNARGAGHEQAREIRDARMDRPLSEEERREGETPRYSPIEVLAQRSFISFDSDELEDLHRALALIARRLALHHSRRFRAARRGHALDLRRTIRRSLKYGGTPLELARKQRKRRKPRLVLVCDVSRSMERYSTFLLQFIHALQHTLGRVESFVFSTRLTRVTDYFRGDNIYSALDRVAREVPDWAGGTRIGDSLATFNRRWAPRIVDRRTVVLILSDGLDSGDAGVLGEQVAGIAQRAARLVWLNPLLGDPAYKPVARTMRAALAHVDVFASAHNLASLEALGRELAR